MNYGDLKECPHCHGTNIQVVKYPIKGGKVQYRHQCMDCGYFDISSIKVSTIPNIDDVPMIDNDLRDWHDANYRAIIEDKQRNFLTLQDYYHTPEWKVRRLHRMAFNKKFFGGKCERCGKNDAEVVHHRSYRVLDGMEHAFDLECICRKCHAMIHPHLREES